MRHCIIPVKIEGRKGKGASVDSTSVPTTSQEPTMVRSSAKDFHAEHPQENEIAEEGADLRFMIDLYVTNGVHLFPKNLSYIKLKNK